MHSNKRPPNIVIASSNTAAMPQGEDGGARTQPSSGRSGDDPSGAAVSAPPSMSAVHSRTVLLADSPASSDDSNALPTPPQPTLIVHSATRTMPFVDFELAHSNPTQPTTAPPSSSAGAQPLPPPYPKTATLPLVIGPPSSGLIKRTNTAAGAVDGNVSAAQLLGEDGAVVPQPQQQLRSACSVATQGGSGGPSHASSFEHESKGIPHTVLTQNLALFVLLKILGSFDSGAFSATLNGDNGITEDWGLSVAQQGTLSSSVFLGNMIGCAIAGHLFSIYSAKMLLFVSLIIHGFFTFLFASAETYEFALLCRFFIGVTLAFIVVYTPVWVDEFAPKSSAATWMAMQNAGVPLGIMLGFVIGGLMPTYTSVSWEWSFYFKTIVMVPIIALVGKTDRRTLDTSSRQAATHELAAGAAASASCGATLTTHNAATTTTTATSTAGNTNNTNSSPKSDTSSSIVEIPASPRTPQESIRMAMLQSYRRFHFIACRLLHNGVYVSNMLSLSSLYFVVSGLQTFITSYLRAEPFNASMETIVIGFGCAVVTAPVFGVVAGGVLLDRIGGYHGNILRASRFGLAWGAVAAVLSVVCVFVDSTMLFLTVVWFLLFCGGAIIPPGSGINMASLPVALRPSGSSVAQMAFNFLGNFSGPLLCGWISEWTGSLTWGVRAVFAMGVLGVVPMSLCTWFAARREKQDRAIADAAEAAAASHHGGGGGGGGGHDQGDDDEVLFSLPQPCGHHHHAGANISIIGALEEAVEAAEESPRNEDEDVELMAISRLSSSFTQNSASFPRIQFPSKSGTPIKRGSIGSSTPPLPTHHVPQRISPGGGMGTPYRGPAQLHHHQLLDVPPTGTMSTRGDSPSLKAKSTPLQSSNSTPHQQHLKSSFARGDVVRSPQISHRSTDCPSSTGPAGAAGSATTPHARSRGRHQQGFDDAEFDAVTMDSGQFNFSFPYQHSFGLDVVRGLLHLDGARTESRQASKSAEGRSPSPVEVATQTQPPAVAELVAASTAQGEGGKWCEHLEQNARREGGGGELES